MLEDTKWEHVMWQTSLEDGGLVMKPYLPKNPIDAESLAALTDLWQATCSCAWTFDLFYARYNAEACADWDVMPPGGGAAKAGSGTRRANGEALAALPYPPAAILYALSYLCPRRCESVARVADWLAWVRAAAQTRGTALPLTEGLFPEVPSGREDGC
jgi:hypothetical protein